MTRLRDMAAIAGPTTERAPFSFAAATRVAFSDTDAQGIVYYGRYPPYFDVARVEYFRHLGHGAHERHPDDGEFVMRHFEIDYHAPAVFDDLLEVFCRAAKVGNSSIVFEYAVIKPDPDAADGEADAQLLATATQVMVYVDLDERRPMRIPDEVRGPIERFERGAAG